MSLKVELARNPRCGLCAFYPITEGYSFQCPVGEKLVYRFKPPPRIGGRLPRYRCFLPTSEKAFEARQRFRLEVERRQHRDYWKKPGRMNKHRENNKVWYNNHKAQSSEYSRVYYYKNPEPHKERARFRGYIEHYNPLKNIMQMFEYHRRMDKRKGLPFETHLTVKELQEIEARRGILGDYEDFLPILNEP